MPRLVGYGVSLILYVRALAQIGAARTGAYFSMAPFAGVLVALMLLGERPGPAFWIVALLMTVGLWLHLTEQHTHQPLRHMPRHVHDAHHGYAHDIPWDGREPHSHEHVHVPITHRHRHDPDLSPTWTRRAGLKRGIRSPRAAAGYHPRALTARVGSGCAADRQAPNRAQL